MTLKKLLDYCPSFLNESRKKESNIRVINEKYLFSSNFIESCLEMLKEYINKTTVNMREKSNSFNENDFKIEILDKIQNWYKELDEEILLSLTEHLFPSLIDLKKSVEQSLFITNSNKSEKTLQIEKKNCIFSP